jgi:diaminohydroxyphosphoribosylaminopyrimidine deaminase/5-amino-6-(5-phosphoribosylamino)uracil reductase
VVTAIHDPSPMVDGRGMARLERAGIDVRVGPLASEVSRQLEAYLHAVRTGRPFVTLKMAASLDGKVAARDGTSRWITGEQARADVHRLRAASDAIVVGAGTALADDPALTVRDPSYRGRPPLRVLADATGRVPATGDLFDGSAPTLVATSELAPSRRREEWTGAGAETLVLETDAAGVRFDALLEHLGKAEVQAVLLEGGPTLAWSAIRDGLVDKVVVYLAPILIGGRDAPGILEGAGFAPIAEALPLEVVDVLPIGRDLRVEAYVHRDR